MEHQNHGLKAYWLVISNIFISRIAKCLVGWLIYCIGVVPPTSLRIQWSVFRWVPRCHRMNAIPPGHICMTQHVHTTRNDPCDFDNVLVAKSLLFLSCWVRITTWGVVAIAVTTPFARFLACSFDWIVYRIICGTMGFFYYTQKALK